MQIDCEGIHSRGQFYRQTSTTITASNQLMEETQVTSGTQFDKSVSSIRSKLVKCLSESVVLTGIFALAIIDLYLQPKYVKKRLSPGA